MRQHAPKNQPIGVSPWWTSIAFICALGLLAGCGGTSASTHATPTASVDPRLHGLTLYISVGDGYVYALNAATGEPRWRFQINSTGDSSATVADGIVYVGSSDHYVYALNAQTGKLVWRYQTGDEVVASPAVAHGVVYAGSNDHYLYALKASDGTLLWRFQAGDAVEASPALDDAHVYIGSWDQCIYALNLADGSLGWRYDAAGGRIRMSLATGGGLVYAGTENNLLVAVNANTG